MVASTVRPRSRAQPVDELEHLLLVADVQRAGRLVEQQHPGALSQRPGQEDPLPFAAGQRLQPAAGERAEIQPRPARRRPRPGRRATPGPAARMYGVRPSST